jgi:phosphonate transport system substrate-binding protein
MTKRREFLKRAGVVGSVGIAGLAGCTSDDGSGDEGSPTSESGMDEGTDTEGGESSATGTATEQGEMYGGELNFIMSPSEPQDEMLAQYTPVKAHLEQTLDVSASLKYGANYSAVVRALGSGTADVAEMGPFAAALGEIDENVNIVLQRKGYGSYTYSSVWVTTEDSDISSLSDLEGKTVALADRLSASGALFPLSMMKQAGLSIGEYPTGDGGADFEVRFAGGHAQAFSALEAGQVDAAGVGKFITVDDNQEIQDGYKYIETADEIPRAPICVSPRLSDKEKTMVTDAFLDAPEKMYLGEDGEADTDDDLWFTAVREADKETYQPVIDVAKDLGVDLDQLDG